MPLTRLDVASLVQVDPRPIPWIVQDLIAQGRVTMLYGEGGLGKSLVSLAAASAVTDGLPFLGRTTRRRKVVIIDSENGEHLLHLRIKAMGLQRNVEAYDARGFDLVHDRAELAGVVGQEFGATAGVLVLDSLRSLAPSMDENDSASTNAVLKSVEAIAREYDVAVLILHHANRGQTFRGSMALKDQVDVLVKMGRDDGDFRRDRRFLRWEKSRLGAEPAPVWLRIVNDEWEDTISVIEACRPDEEPNPWRG